MNEIPDSNISYTIIRDLPSIFRKTLTYAPLPSDQYLTIPEADGPYLRKPLPLAPRTSEFRIVHQTGVRLRGFRAYTTPDDRFFTDDLLVKENEVAPYTARFTAGKFEDFSASFQDGTAILEQRDDSKTIDEPVISLASAEPSNYGSWIFRFLPKLINTELGAGRSILVYQHSHWIKRLLSFFHGSDLKLIPHWPDQTYYLRDALIPTPRNRSVYFDEGSLQFYRESANRISGTLGLEKIYLSRQSQKIRPLVNEIELISKLRDRGYSIVIPESLSLEDQLRVVRDARFIVCPGGSGLFNLVFARSAELVVDIEAGQDWVFAHQNIMRSCGLRHTIVFGERLNPSTPHSPWTIDVASVLGALP